jgi:hypothetical protein
VRGIVDAHLAILDAVAAQMTEVERELLGLARSDRRLLALQTIYGVGPIVACHLPLRSATRAASAAPTRSSASPGSTRSRSTQPRQSAAASSKPAARSSCTRA